MIIWVTFQFSLSSYLEWLETLYVNKNINILGILYIRKLQYRHSFFIHSLGYLLFLISGLLVCHCADKEGGMCNSLWIYLITIISSAISGFTSSGLFIT